MELSRKARGILRDYIEHLPPVLKEHYSGSGYSGYSAGQITAAVEACKLPTSHVRLALLLFGCEDTVDGLRLSANRRDEILRELQETSEQDKSFVDRLLTRLAGFLEKAGSIPEGSCG